MCNDLKNDKTYKDIVEYIDDYFKSNSFDLDYTDYGINNTLLTNPNFISQLNSKGLTVFRKNNYPNIDYIPKVGREEVKLEGKVMKITDHETIADDERQFMFYSFKDIEKIVLQKFGKTWYLKIEVRYSDSELPHSGCDLESLKPIFRDGHQEFFKQMIRFKLSANSQLQPTSDSDSFKNFLGAFEEFEPETKTQSTNYSGKSYKLKDESMDLLNTSGFLIMSEFYKVAFNRKNYRDGSNKNLESDDDYFNDSEYNKYLLVGVINNPLQIYIKDLEKIKNNNTTK